MKIEEKILELLNKEFSDKQIVGIRFVEKTGESSWQFRYTYQDGDYLSISEKMETEFDGLMLKLKKNQFISPGVSIIEKDNSKNKLKQKQK